MNLFLAKLLKSVDGGTAAVRVLRLPGVQQPVVVPGTVEKLEVLVRVLEEWLRAYLYHKQPTMGEISQGGKHLDKNWVGSRSGRPPRFFDKSRSGRDALS